MTSIVSYLFDESTEQESGTTMPQKTESQSKNSQQPQKSDSQNSEIKTPAVFSGGFFDSENDISKKTKNRPVHSLNFPRPEKPCPCGSPIFWLARSGIARCLGCSPPAHRSIVAEIVDIIAPLIAAGEDTGEAAGLGSGGGCCEGGDGGAAAASHLRTLDNGDSLTTFDARSPWAAVTIPDFEAVSAGPGGEMFWDARRRRWIGSVRELMGYDKRA